jgi:RecJ-like exonuclease
MNEEICTVCGGEGTIESEFFVRASVDNDYGFIDTKVEECEACDGMGYNETEEANNE